MSQKTTSYSSREARARASRDAGRLAHDVHAADPLEEVAQLGPRRCLVVDDQREQAHGTRAGSGRSGGSIARPGGAVGTTTETSVPSSGAETMRSRPWSP